VTNMVKKSSGVAVATRMADFRTALQQGIEGIVKASEIYVAALDDDPQNADRFRDEFASWVPATTWAQFEAVGRKLMHPRLLMGGVSDYRKSTLIRRLPYSMQERVFGRERFELLTKSGSTLKVDLLEATPEQAEQLCDGSSIRNLSAQKAWLESRAAAAASVVEPAELLPYIISQGRVVFRRGCTLSRAEVKRLLTDM